MSKLVVPLSKMTDQGLTIHAVVSATELAGEGVSDVPAGNVTLSGTLTEIGPDYLFRGSVSGMFTQPCARCLVDAPFRFNFEVCWAFVEGPEENPLEEWAQDGEHEAAAVEDSASIRFQGNEIDLGPRTWEEVVLEMPAKFLCKPDCAGLCPMCGADLNGAPCRCGRESKLENKGLAGLGNLFPNLRPKG